jgi:hypothetical protein
MKMGVSDLVFIKANKEYGTYTPDHFKFGNIKISFKERIEKDLKTGLNELKNALFSDSPRFNELVSIIARFNEAEKKYRIGGISASDHSAELNKLTPAILEFIDLLEEQDIDIDVVKQNGYRR